MDVGLSGNTRSLNEWLPGNGSLEEQWLPSNGSLEDQWLPGNGSEDEWWQHHAGYSLLSVGAVGLLLNTVILLYLYNLKTDTLPSEFSRIAFINLSLSDFILSLSAISLRGPGYVWPDKIWGIDQKGEKNDWCLAGLLLTWFASDLNLLAVVPLSMLYLLLYVPCMSLSKRNIIAGIVCCWMVPLLEQVFIVVCLVEKKLVYYFDPHYGRCGLFNGNGPDGVNFEWLLNRENSTTFFALPLAMHVLAWSFAVYFICRSGEGFYDPQWRKYARTGLIVVVTFTVTWLPYFIVVPWHGLLPSHNYTFVYTCLYCSVILNPIIYGIRSMQFNGKTVWDVVEDWCCTLRARALSLPPRRASEPPPQPFSEADGNYDSEEMVSSAGFKR